MGDLVHTLPALTDAVHNIPNIKFDWVVDGAFAEIPTWHVAVDKVIKFDLRKWRAGWVKAWQTGAIREFWSQLTANHYDVVIDAQGLIKSAVVARFSKADKIIGFASKSCREAKASWFYHEKFNIDFQQHAMSRTRALFANALGYATPESSPEYGINWQTVQADFAVHESGANTKRQIDFLDKPYIVFLHGTTWATKHWPDIYWQELAGLAAKDGMAIKLTWVTQQQKRRAEFLAQNSSNITVLETLTLAQAAMLLKHAKGVVAVDTGFVHLAAALGTPSVSIYGATDPDRTGAYGEKQVHARADFACAPCFSKVCKYVGRDFVEDISDINDIQQKFPPCYAGVSTSPQVVWDKLLQILK